MKMSDEELEIEALLERGEIPLSKPGKKLLGNFLPVSARTISKDIDRITF